MALQELLTSGGIYTLTVLALLALLAVRQLFPTFRRKTPPGPWGLPLVGYTPFLGRTAHITISKLGERYGSIFMFKFGSHPLVVLNDYEAIKSAYVNQPDVFAGRPDMFVQLDVFGDTAFVALDDPTAFEHRHFSVRVINKLRLGTWPMEQRIADEVAHLVERFRSEQGAPFEPHSAIAFSASNVICALAFGRRFDETDERLKALIETQEVLLRTALSQTGAVQVLPWLRFLWPWRGAWRSYRASIARLHVAMGQLMDESECESRRVEHDDHHEVRSYVDAFAQRQRADSGNPRSTFTRRRLLYSLQAFFIGGADSITHQLQWALLVLLHNTHVQKRMQLELDEVVGRGRCVSTDDRARLPYVEASILEIVRYTTMMPAVLRRTLSDTTLDGYFIGKGTWILPNFWSAFRDVKHFDEPHLFQPERFLDDSGRVVKGCTLIPFGIGKRQCLGEATARLELFLYIANLVHRFQLHVPDGETLQPLEGTPTGLVIAAPLYRCCAVDRF